MVIGTERDWNGNYGYYGDTKNLITIESLESPVPSCLWRLSPTIDSSETIKSPLGSVIGKFLDF